MTRMPRDPEENDFPKMSQPAHQALSGAGYSRLEQLAQVGEHEIKRLHGIGPNALNKLRQALADKGLSFAEPMLKTPKK